MWYAAAIMQLHVLTKGQVMPKKLNIPDPHHADAEFQSMAIVCRRIGLSASTVRRLIAKKEFPAPTKITECRLGFFKANVDKWIEDTYMKGRADNDN
jgi:predicted DNA-binding transcriptional regulator AlpA